MRKGEEARPDSVVPTTGAALGADVIAAYLRAHPDFLSHHPDLLRHMEPPKRHRGDGVVDFQHYMVERLQRDMDRLSAEQGDLIATARDNLLNQNRVHRAVLAMLDARDLSTLVTTITMDLAVMLDLDVVALAIESTTDGIPYGHGSGVRVVAPGTVDGWLETRKIVLHSDIEADPTIFGEGAGLVRSQALLRLEISGIAPNGLLALGSREPRMFETGQGTELVGFLARVVERALRAVLDLPPPLSQRG